MKKRLNISLDEETAEKLKELAKDSHKNMSQWITDKVWEETKKVKDKQPKSER
jgi:predicted transcriptional regulator